MPLWFRPPMKQGVKRCRRYRQSAPAEHRLTNKAPQPNRVRRAPLSRCSSSPWRRQDACEQRLSRSHWALRSRLIVAKVPSSMRRSGPKGAGRAQASRSLRAASDVAMAELTAELREARRPAGMRRRWCRRPRRVGGRSRHGALSRGQRRCGANKRTAGDRSTPAIAIAPHTPGPLALPGPMTLRRAAGMR